jgi:hypothetical protein
MAFLLHTVSSSSAVSVILQRYQHLLSMCSAGGVSVAVIVVQARAAVWTFCVHVTDHGERGRMV